jgi:hypothetical protein
MYEIHDNTERYHHEVLFDFEQDSTDTLDHWTLRDFADIVPFASFAS